MVGNNTENMVRRSRLIMPANNKRFIERAFKRNADAIVLDLEDSVSIAEKSYARLNIRDNIAKVAKGGSDIIVRVNNNETMLEEDIKAATCTELDSIYLPKVENSQQVQDVDKLLSKLETEHNFNNKKIKIGITIETAKGLLNLTEITRASTRIDSISLGIEDFSYNTDLSIMNETKQGLLYVQMQILTAAKAYGKLPLGLLSRISNYKDLDEIKQSANLAHKYGFVGASCIHPANVEILNKCFSPSEEDVTYSSKVVSCFEKTLEKGKASMKLDDQMIDYVHYRHAKKILDRNLMIKEFERKKKNARDKMIGGNNTD